MPGPATDVGEPNRAILIRKAGVAGLLHHDLTATHEVVHSQLELRNQVDELVLVDESLGSDQKASLVGQAKDEATPFEPVVLLPTIFDCLKE